MFHCHVPKHMDCPLIPELQQALNNDHSKLATMISELRYWITCRRCEKTLQHLPATSHDTLPLRYTNESKLKTMSKHRVYIKLHRQPNVVLIVALQEKPEQPTEMEYTFYLALGTHEATDSTASTTTVEAAAADAQIAEPAAKLYLKVWSVVEFDTFVNTHGPGTYVDGELFKSKRHFESTTFVFQTFSSPALLDWERERQEAVVGILLLVLVPRSNKRRSIPRISSPNWHTSWRCATRSCRS